MTEISQKPRKLRIKAGAPYGHFFPGKMRHSPPLSDDEFKLVADALKLLPKDAARLPGFAGQGFDHGFRAALDYALMHYVAARRAAGALSSQREVALAFIKFAGRMNDAVEALQMHRDSLRGATLTREASVIAEMSLLTGSDGKLLINIARDACHALADAAINKTAHLNESAGQKVKHPPIDTISFIVTLREIFNAAGLSTSVGTVAAADIPEREYPMLGIARCMLTLALKRMDGDCEREETQDAFDKKRVAFFKFVSNAKIT